MAQWPIIKQVSSQFIQCLCTFPPSLVQCAMFTISSVRVVSAGRMMASFNLVYNLCLSLFMSVFLSFSLSFSHLQHSISRHFAVILECAGEAKVAVSFHGC